jgi:polysaccharide deacetylase family protein (PEP-CTERM system associated)
MRNVISIDVEDYFHVEAFASRIRPDEWDRFTPRVEENVDRVLALLDRHRTSGTFFVLGWVARRFPRLVREIAKRGHEIGCHGFGHQHISRQSPDQFRWDIRSARMCLMDEVQKPVYSYRAPSFSVTRETLWALDVLAEEGFRFDSSIFPVRHDLYGIPDGSRFPYWHVTPSGSRLFEFPPSTVKIAANRIGVAGGGYLRLLPYEFTRWAITRLNQVEKQPAMVYFHPWELDPEQPRVAAPLRSRLRHYTNLSRTERRLEHLLQDFRFATLSAVCEELDSYQSGAPAVAAAAAAPQA